jgi:peptidyl-prolyl cis-trans isomerase SurA
MDFNSMSSLSRNPSTRRWQVVFAACLAAVFRPQGPLSVAQETDSTATSQPEIVATVNGTAITADQVQRDMMRTLRGVNLSPARRLEARAATLDKLINQRIAFEFLKKHRIAAGDEEVLLQIEELKAELETVEKTIDDYLQQTNQTLIELRFQTAWQISWKRYLQRKLTDEFLESHFNQRKRQMDGTELRVAHLLLKPPKDNTPEQLADLTQQAKTIGEQINKTSLTWDEAVARHSQAPTRDSGGLIGWIKVDGPMPRSFTQAAFKLSAGKISEPVTTKFGVHIIKCLEVKEGKLGWRDIIDEVRKSASRAYFDAIVEQHRPEVTIKR